LSWRHSSLTSGVPIHEEASIEFHLPAMDALGRLDLDGKVRFSEGVVYVHWKRRNRTFTRTQNKLETAEIGLGDVEGCSVDKGWFSTAFHLDVKDPRLLDAMPGVEMGKLSVKLEKSQRKAAEKLVSVLEFELSRWKAEHSRRRLERLEEAEAAAEDKVESVNPGETSVR